MKLKALAGLSLAAFAFASTPASGQAQHPPGSNEILKEVQVGAAKRFVYELEATAWLLFIPVTGKALFDTHLEGQTYSINSAVKTTGIADIFVDYNLSLAASGYVKENGLQTYNYVSQNNDGKKNRRVEMTYGADDVVMTATPRFGDLGDPAATPEQKLMALDPLSALVSNSFEPRTPDNPCGGPLLTFDGKQLTKLTMTYQGPADIRTKAWKGKGYECHVQMERVAGYKKGDKGKNLSGIDGPMKMYFAEAIPGLTTMVKLVVDTEDIGKVTLQASKLQLIDAAPRQAEKASASKS